MLFDRFDPLKGDRLEIMDKDGNVNEKLRPDLSDVRLKELYIQMSVMRLADKTALNLQREGRMGTYAPFTGRRLLRRRRLSSEKKTGSFRRTVRAARSSCAESRCRGYTSTGWETREA